MNTTGKVAIGAGVAGLLILGGYAVYVATRPSVPVASGAGDPVARENLVRANANAAIDAASAAPRVTPSTLAVDAGGRRSAVGLPAAQSFLDTPIVGTRVPLTSPPTMLGPV